MIGNLSKLVLICAFLAACSSASDRQMYKGKPTSEQTSDTQSLEVAAIAPMAAARLSAIRAFGLDKDPKPAKLLGLNQFDVERALGKPAFVRRDEGVEIWQYRANGCILDLFLYDQRDGLYVDHSELRGPTLDTAGELACLNRIIMGQS